MKVRPGSDRMDPDLERKTLQNRRKVRIQRDVDADKSIVEVYREKNISDVTYTLKKVVSPRHKRQVVASTVCEYVGSRRAGCRILGLLQPSSRLDYSKLEQPSPIGFSPFHSIHLTKPDHQ